MPRPARFRPDLAPEQVDRELRRSLRTEEQARRQALLWFHEVMRRNLHQDLGHPSLHAYARLALGFTDNRYWQFQRLARDLDRLPALHAALSGGEIGWTKAQLVARVATPASIRRWLKRARELGRRDLAEEIRRARDRDHRASRRAAGPAADRPTLDLRSADCPGNAAQGQAGDGRADGNERASAATASADRDLAPGPPGGSPSGKASAPARAPGSRAQGSRPPGDLPLRVALSLSPRQLAQLESMLESVRKRRILAPDASREEILLAALERLASASPTGARCQPQAQAAAHPRAPYTVVVYQCRDCQRAEVVTHRGHRPLGQATTEAVIENARIHDAGRNWHPVSPARRAAVLARDGHRCRAPGCGSTAFLEVHHIVPRARGGAHSLANLVTLCSRCHRFVHGRLERGLLAPVLGGGLAEAADPALHGGRDRDPKPSARGP